MKTIFPQIDRYECLSELGEGGMGVVFEVFDKRRRLRLAFKTFPARPEGHSRFKREFRAVANLRHPNLVRLYDLGSIDGSLYYTMELIRGVEPRRFLGQVGTSRDTMLEPTGPEPTWEEGLDRRALARFEADPLAAASIIAQVAYALEFLHAQGMVHRDLKPDNILVAEDGVAKILDFGLIQEKSKRTLELKGIVGTPAYMAPEQMMGEAVGPSADMYSLGVILYEILTGRLPFLGRNTLELMANRLAAPLQPPSELTEGVPKPLEELALRLLAKEPEARLTARQASDFIRRAYRVPPPPRGRGSAANLPFVGRRAHKRLLEAILDSGKGGIALWPGSPGMGKTRLLREARAWLETHKVLCLTGRCVERESIPFRAFDRAIDALAVHLSNFTRAQLEALNIELGPLVRLFPVLAELKALASYRQQPAFSDPIEERERAFVALYRILAARAKEGPIALILDDLHHADEGSLRLLEALCRGEDDGDLGPGEAAYISTAATMLRMAPSTPPAIFILSWTPEEASPALTDLTSRLGASMPLEPLDDEDERKLLQSAASPQQIPEAMFSAMQREAAGSPRWCIELGRAFSEDKTAAYTIGALLRRKVSALPEVRRKVLTAVVYGGRASFDVLASATRLPEDTLAGELDELLLAELVRLSIDPRVGDIYEAVDEALDGAVRVGITQEESKALHFSLAEAFVAAKAPAALIAAQLAAAGESVRAAPISLQAARAQREALAFEYAIDGYRLALRLGLSPSDAQAAREELATVLYYASRHQEAAQEWRALAKERSGLPRAVTILRAAEADLDRGALQEAMDSFNEVLVACDGASASLQRSRGKVLASIAWGYLEGEARFLLQGRGARPEEFSIETGLRLELYVLLAGHLTAFAPERAMECGARYLAMAIKSGDPEHSCLALEIAAMHLSLAGTGPAMKLAATYQAHAEELLPQVSDKRNLARRALVRGVAANARGDFADALPWMDQAEARLKALGMGPSIEMVSTCVYGSVPELWLGKLQEAEARCMRVLRPSQSRQNLYAVADLLASVIMARLYRGELTAAKAALAEAPPEFLDGGPTLPKVNIRRAEVDLLLALGDVKKATERYDQFTVECASIIQAPLWLRVEVAQLGLRVALALAATGDARGVRRGRALEKTATDGASPARLARSLRHLAELDLCAGDRTSARLRLTAAEASLKRQDAPFERACLLARLALLEPSRKRQAEALLTELGAAHPSVFEKWTW